MRFEASQAVFWSLTCYKELKLNTKPFTGRTLRGLLIHMQIILLACEVRACTESKISSKSDTAVLTFTFLASFLVSLAGHLVGFILVGKVFRKALILGS